MNRCKTILIRGNKQMYQMYCPFMLRRAQMSPVLLIAIIALTSIAISPLIKHTEAGKGKGRQGHIIVQNEVKGNPVPIYMPIPIPIPMPMGPQPPPPAHAGPQQHHHHHQAGGSGGGGGHSKYFHQQHHHYQMHHNNGADDQGEGEVKKIYLLQPMPRAQPQPQLKGGGFMGPVQNHIHVSPGHVSSLASAGKHRHSPSSASNQHRNFQHHHQQQQQQQQLVMNDGDTGSGSGSTGHKSEVKILPIVVIPPMAPMPPIQVTSAPQTTTSSGAHRLMFSPQFNNFLVSGPAQSSSDHTSKRHRQRTLRGLAGSGGAGNVQYGDSFADYGGSLGGSTFRDHFASRSRPSRSRSLMQAANSVDYGSIDLNNFQQLQQQQQQQLARKSRSWRDYDYADYDYEGPAASRDVPLSAYLNRDDQGAVAMRRRQYRAAAAAAAGQQRRYRADAARFKSIRDIIEAHKAARFDDYEQAVGGDQQLDGYGQASVGGSDNGYESAPTNIGPIRTGQYHQQQQQQQQQSSLGSDLTLDSLAPGTAPSLTAAAAAAAATDQQRSVRILRGQATGVGTGTGSGSYEISLDELSSQLASADSSGQQRQLIAQRLANGGGGVSGGSSSSSSNNNNNSYNQQLDLSALYYDRSNASWPGANSDGGDLAQRLRQAPTYRQSSLSSSSSSSPLTEGRDLFDEDEWRFDSIKSVAHVAATASSANGTMTLPPSAANGQAGVGAQGKLTAGQQTPTQSVLAPKVAANETNSIRAQP